MIWQARKYTILKPHIFNTLVLLLAADGAQDDYARQYEIGEKIGPLYGTIIRHYCHVTVRGLRRPLHGPEAHGPEANGA